MPSPMVRVLEELGKFRVPKDFGPPQLDWNGAFKIEDSSRVSDTTLCPCECLVGDDDFGCEIQHHDGFFGRKDGPAGHAFANALCRQADGYNNMQGLVAPNLAPPVRTVLITKVETNNMVRICQFWGAAQAGAAKAVCDCWENGYFPKEADKTHVIGTGIFIFPYAGLQAPGESGKWDKKKFLEGPALQKSMHAIYCLVYATMVGMLFDAVTGGLTTEERIERAKTARHPFLGFKFAGDA